MSKKIIVTDFSKKTAASPKVRKFARELGVDISKVEGSERLGRVTESDIKSFVAKTPERNIEKETRKILDFLDVDFEESCIKFYKNKRSIDTASVIQARKPIYKNSINSWMNYKDFLKPLTDKLKESFKTNL